MLKVHGHMAGRGRASRADPPTCPASRLASCRRLSACLPVCHLLGFSPNLRAPSKPPPPPKQSSAQAMTPPSQTDVGGDVGRCLRPSSWAPGFSPIRDSWCTVPGTQPSHRPPAEIQGRCAGLRWGLWGAAHLLPPRTGVTRAPSTFKLEGLAQQAS